MTTLSEKTASLIIYANDRRDTSYTNLTDIIANELNAEQTPVTHIPSATIEERTQSLIDYANEKCNTSYDNLTDVILNDLKGQRTYSIEEKEPYIYRKTANGLSIGGQKQETIVGGSIVWNQHTHNNNPVSAMFGSGITLTKAADGTYIANGTADTNCYIYSDKYDSVTDRDQMNLNHIYLTLGCPSGGGANTYRIGFCREGTTLVSDYGSGVFYKNTTYTNRMTTVIYIMSGQTLTNLAFKPQIFDLTQMFGSEVADALYSMEQASAGSGVAVFRSMFPNEYYEYNAGELKSVEGLQKHVTTGFNLFDKTDVVSDYYINDANGEPRQTSLGAKCTNYIRLLPNAKYYIKSDQTSGAWGAWYDVNKNYISGITAYRASDTTKEKTSPANAYYMRLTCEYNRTGNVDTLCINLSDPAKNGTYEPHKANIYPLDSDIVLRGIPKFANGQIYFDGDTYESDGKVTRKYGIVDLGTLNWQLRIYESRKIFTVYNLPGGVGVTGETGKGNAICDAYPVVMNSTVSTDAGNKTMAYGAYYASGANIYVQDSDYSDVTDFKTAMNGVYLVYELATPTTETADPFTNPQIVDKYGTEEYVCETLGDVVVPVGHNTLYSTD